MRRSAFACGLLGALLIAGGAEARGYSCVDADHAPDKQWNLKQDDAVQMLGDWEGQADAKSGNFMLRFCGEYDDGNPMILINAFRVHHGKRRCDDPENFSMLYDPKVRSFGEKISGQAFCTEGVER